MSSLLSQRTSSPAEKPPSSSTDRVVGFSRRTTTRRGVRRRPTSQSPTRGTLVKETVPALALSVVTTNMGINSDSPNSGKMIYKNGGIPMSPSAARAGRRDSVSDGEEEEDDREEMVPKAEVFNETPFRKMYICSDFSAKKATGRLSTRHVPSDNTKEVLCRHGLKLGVCTENECCEIVTAKITRSDRRMSGKFTGRKLVEYHVHVTFKNCQASIWHRYSGFRTFYELFSEKHGNEDFSMFPRRHLNKWSRAVTEERMVALDAFLQSIVANPKYRNDSLFKDFLSVDENARRQFYEPSASQSHDIEIRQLSKEISDLKFNLTTNLKGGAKKSSSDRNFRESKNAK